jgi:hypothetical protein
MYLYIITMSQRCWSSHAHYGLFILNGRDGGGAYLPRPHLIMYSTIEL